MNADARIRLLRILEILREMTDEDHPISTAELATVLKEKYGIEAYRITIQKDIAALCDAGYEVETVHTTQNKYYLAEQVFELPELKLLIDAVESSKFITERKSSILVRKLMSMASQNQQSSLQRNISIANRIKASNEQIYYIMDAINDAINSNRKISFLYFEHTITKSKRLKNDGNAYILSPYTMTWNGDFYYVVGYSEKHKKLATFRVDRIFRVPEILPELAVKKPKDYCIADFSEKAFQLFDKEHVNVSLLCCENTMNTVIDHFGDKVKIEPVDEDHFRLTTEVAPSPTFFAWVFQFGGSIKIESPNSVKSAYNALIRQVLETL